MRAPGRHQDAPRHRPRRHQDRGRGAGTRWRSCSPSTASPRRATTMPRRSRHRRAWSRSSSRQPARAAASASACRARSRRQAASCRTPIRPGSTASRSRAMSRPSLGRPVRLANDANCFALSEAADGAAAGAASVFGVILGTGCGGGLVFDGRLIDGPRGIGGEWGHNPLPWADADEHPGPRCWCGRYGCMETWVSGPGLEADHARATGERLAAEEIAARAGRGDAQARATPRSSRQPARPRARARGQHLRPARDRAGRRPVAAFSSLRGAARPDGAAHLCRRAQIT